MGVAQGYLNRDDLTEEVFIHDPFSKQPNARMYKTGDLACFRIDGTVEYMGRIDNQVKIRGFRIELDEIDSVISEHPEVLRSVVIDHKLEDGRVIIVGYYVAMNQDLTEKLRNLLVDKLPAYMVPQVLIGLEAIPLTSNGKTDRKALPSPDLSALSQHYVEPTSKTEIYLCNAWSSLLTIEKIGIRDNFFDLGGHSLLATRFISKLRSERSIELPLKEIFNYPTIEELAKLIDDPQRYADKSTLVLPPLVARAVDSTESLALSYAQQRL